MDPPLFSAPDRQVGGPRRSRWGVPQPPSREGAQGPPACRPSYSCREGLNLLQLVQIVLAQPSEPRLACPSRPAKCWPQGAARNMHEHCYFSSLLDHLTLHTPQFSISANLPPANLSGLGVGPPVGWLDGCCIGRMSFGLAPRLPSVVLVSDCPRARPRGLPQSPAPRRPHRVATMRTPPAQPVRPTVGLYHAASKDHANDGYGDVKSIDSPVQTPSRA